MDEEIKALKLLGAVEQGRLIKAQVERAEALREMAAARIEAIEQQDSYAAQRSEFAKNQELIVNAQVSGFDLMIGTYKKKKDYSNLLTVTQRFDSAIDLAKIKEEDAKQRLSQELKSTQKIETLLTRHSISRAILESTFDETLQESIPTKGKL